MSNIGSGDDVRDACRKFAEEHAGEVMDWVNPAGNRHESLRVVGWGQDQVTGWWWVWTVPPSAAEGGTARHVNPVVPPSSFDPKLVRGFSHAFFVASKPKLDKSKYPHVCPKLGCGKPAYLGFNSIDCSAGCK